MRFLLFVALALLPLSAAIKCFDGQIIHTHNGTDGYQTERNCDRSRFCLHVHVKKVGKESFGGRCLSDYFDKDLIEKYCHKKECVERGNSKITTHSCCCATDLCNKSMDTVLNSTASIGARF